MLREIHIGQPQSGFVVVGVLSQGPGDQFAGPREVPRGHCPVDLLLGLAVFGDVEGQEEGLVRDGLGAIQLLQG